MRSDYLEQYARQQAQQEIRGNLSKLIEKMAKARHASASHAPHAASGNSHEGKNEILLVTPQAGFGEFSSPVCFPLAREIRTSPHAIASEIAKEYNELISKEKKTSARKDALIEKVSAENGYLNFFASENYFTLALGHSLEMGAAYGKGEAGKGKLFVIEYSDPNVGKPFHVGHIRGTILGSAIARLRKTAGWKTFQYAYLGDAGTQVAKLAVALEEFKGMRKASDEKQLLEYYVKIHEEAKTRPEIEERARELLSKIEAGDKKIIAKISEIKKISMRGFEKNWKRLGVKFDLVTGESAFIAKAREVVGECERKGIASRDQDGTVVLELEQHGIPNTILMRSNGTTLYLTRDFPREEFIYELTKKKFGRNYDESLIITASEQNTHFRQLYKSFELLHRPFAPRVKHMGFGLVSLESGKISSREGRVIFLEDVLNEAKQIARNEIISRELPYSQKEVDGIAEKVGVGSVKFAFLRVGSEKNITYSPEAATRFSGDSGAYLQYTCVRAKNILRKAKEEKLISGEKNAAKELSKKISLRSAKGKTKNKKDTVAFNETEKKIISLLAEFPGALSTSSANFQPHSLCEFLLKVGSAFSEFYEKCPVLKAENEQEKYGRLAIVRSVQTVLENGLAVLGIEVPDKM